MPFLEVVDKMGRFEITYNIFDRLLKDRLIFIRDEIDEWNSSLVVAQLLFLQMESKTQGIGIYINCYGGDTAAGLAILDTMRYISCPVSTYCIGQAGGITSLILGGGQKGKRSGGEGQAPQGRNRVGQGAPGDEETIP